MELSEGLHLCLKLKDMEIKDNKLIIDIPKGMEVDKENTDVVKGVIMLRKKKVITYEDVEDTLSIEKDRILINTNDISKLRNLNKLMDIAKFYNGDWKPELNNRNEDKHYIYYGYIQNEYYVDAGNTYNHGIVYFKNKADAQAVIDNPNFRQILDAIYKD